MLRWTRAAAVAVGLVVVGVNAGVAAADPPVPVPGLAPPSACAPVPSNPETPNEICTPDSTPAPVGTGVEADCAGNHAVTIQQSAPYGAAVDEGASSVLAVGDRPLPDTSPVEDTAWDAADGATDGADEATGDLAGAPGYPDDLACDAAPTTPTRVGSYHHSVECNLNPVAPSPFTKSGKIWLRGNTTVDCTVIDARGMRAYLETCIQRHVVTPANIDFGGSWEAPKGGCRHQTFVGDQIRYMTRFATAPCGHTKADWRTRSYLRLINPFANSPRRTKVSSVQYFDCTSSGGTVGTVACKLWHCPCPPSPAPECPPAPPPPGAAVRRSR
jgi:hypothetical protein